MTVVTVYSTPTCPYCVMVKKYLEEKKVEFKDVNVAVDKEAAREMIKRSGQMGVPQILIGDKIIVGFDREAIEAALAEEK